MISVYRKWNLPAPPYADQRPTSSISSLPGEPAVLGAVMADSGSRDLSTQPGDILAITQVVVLPAVAHRWGKQASGGLDMQQACTTPASGSRACALGPALDLALLSWGR